MKSESVTRKRKGKREYLNDAETKRMMKELERYFETKVEIPTMRHRKTQAIDTLISEETLLLARARDILYDMVVFRRAHVR